MIRNRHFFTDANKEVPTLKTSQMREVDRIAMEETGPNLFQMMENAGRNLAEMALECFGEDWQRARIVVLAGTGGNGGGAFAELIHWANSTGASIISLDVPSVLDSTTGVTPGEFIRPSCTMTLALPKSGLGRAEGELILADIGIPEESLPARWCVIRFSLREPV